LRSTIVVDVDGWLMSLRVGFGSSLTAHAWWRDYASLTQLGNAPINVMSMPHLDSWWGLYGLCIRLWLDVIANILYRLDWLYWWTASWLV